MSSNTAVEQIARAVLYEGYLLYPYRRSSSKNKQRWNFGVLYPEAWTTAQTGSDRSSFQMEIPVHDAHSQLDVTVRFLHLLTQGEGSEAWQEAVEREVTIPGLSLTQLKAEPHRVVFSFPAGVHVSENVIRRQEMVQGEVTVSAAAHDSDLFKLTLQVRNTTALDTIERNEALLLSLASAHAVISARDGELLSVTDPPPGARGLAATCANTGVWPVLVGEEGTHDTVLASPIILYDYPKIAPESAGDLFDGLEIDEILTLRILTLTEAEREEMRNSSDHARAILERAENLSPERLLDMHGAVRGLRTLRDEPEPLGEWNPWAETPQLRSVHIAGVELHPGDRVRLRPGKRADIFDTLLEGKIAIIEAIEQDFEEKIHLAVTIEDDPGRDLGVMRQSGHRFFFSVAEVEPLAGEP